MEQGHTECESETWMSATWWRCT